MFGLLVAYGWFVGALNAYLLASVCVCLGKIPCHTRWVVQYVVYPCLEGKGVGWSIRYGWSIRWLVSWLVGRSVT